jgi:hypothetical protein
MQERTESLKGPWTVITIGVALFFGGLLWAFKQLGVLGK